MDQIKHFLHIHPLALTDESEIDDEVVCSGCLNPLAGPFYGCSDRKFHLHKSCAELPREIQYFFHPCPLVHHILSYTIMCNACFKNVSGFRYSCKKCSFDMHVKCTQRREEVIHHFTHKHPLALLDEKKDLKVRCGICEKPSSTSLDSSLYGCEKCNFFLRTSCMVNIPPQINHFSPIVPSHSGISNTLRCNGCDKYTALPFHCGRCSFQLDVKCAFLPTAESKGAKEIQHFAHGHPLALRESKEFDNELVWCRACGENCSGFCFVCKRCNFLLHRQCSVEFPLETEIHHPFHPSHPLTLSPLPWDLDHDIFPCQACDVRSDRFMTAYQCVKCDFNILIEYCAKPMLQHILFKYGDHPHFLRLCDKTQDKIYCDVCNWPVCNCFLQCVQCQFNIHLYCVPSTPKAVTDECHLHPLTLTKSPSVFELNTSEDEYNSDDEFYCDICEEEKFKRASVYYCEECKFIAEIRYVKSKLLPSLITSKGQSGVDCRVISEDDENSELEAAIAKVNVEIEAVSAEKKTLEAEKEKHQRMMETLQEEIKPIEERLNRLGKVHSRYSDELKRRNENKSIQNSFPVQQSAQEEESE